MVKNLLSLINKGKFFYVLSLLFLALYIISLFLNLGVAPFYNEEPRRSIIAMEMLFNNNFMVTTLFNDVFYDHPPLWNIILAGSSWLFGTDTEFAFRFPSALSLLLTGVLVYLMGKKHVGQLFGTVSAFLYLVSVDLYFFFSNTAEIDIFFSLLIFTSIMGIYHFYEQKRFVSLYLYTYFFCFLGFLTKGVVSLVFLGVSLLIFFMYKKDYRKLFLPIHFLSAFLCLGGIAMFFYVYGQYDDAYAYIEGMWRITRNKSILDKANNAFLAHFFWFPINMLGNLFPATLLIPFLFKKSVVQKIKEHPYILFLIIVFFSNFIIYWISPGAKARYTYMFYPMLISILTFAFLMGKNRKGWKTKILFGVLSCLSLLLGISCFALPFINYFDTIEGVAFFSILFGICGLTLFLFQLKTHNIWNKLVFGLMGIVLCKLVFSLTVYPLKQQKSSSATFKNHAKNILKITKDAPIHLYSEFDFFDHHKIGKFYTTGAYLELLGNQLTRKTSTFKEKGYYILLKEELKGQKVLYTIDNRTSCLVLIKNEEEHPETWSHIPESSAYQNGVLR
ncbi:MAG: phospholipid carrier-dependent glycosyltransferase [Algicola sp.]|nr:phospholipid carrier-dependent glycosyltransferase [Algicola sp.]